MAHVAECAHPLVSVPARYLFTLLMRPDLSEAARGHVRDYATLGDLFARPLTAGARPADPAPDALLCPADGRITGAGLISRDAGQVRGKHGWLAVETLLGAASPEAGLPAGTAWISIYLPASGYHRVHMPCAAAIGEARRMPGRLAGVRPASWTASACAESAARCARNERVVFRLHRHGAPHPPIILVMVGAAGVGSIVTSPRTAAPGSAGNAHTARGDVRAAGEELAGFRLGSTVVLIAPGVSLDASLTPGDRVRACQRIGRIRGGGA
jgi:phosphatidylserine decarboxylase